MRLCAPSGAALLGVVLLLAPNLPLADTFHGASFDLRPERACITESARAEIHAEIARNMARLAARGALEVVESSAKRAGGLGFPLRPAEGLGCLVI